ncbi:prephenate dehydrogenase/arogenate dehydrogenase family protein [Scytonema sp. UIC 10036]|uniref:prephenate dehydrogenase/arogenate dehydrogenase family protein n=1 Tax=Scytonema sp. UIC 10036 TaxID=2304196 RepID=UPI0012DA8C01|nr:prephenate dehydrogenase/arogenate dehydrogenase family protein [Scytonema sp. UIC 10036]MUG91038.1 prephenate dehydrogenase/arogenate dehydrogenase family protein [Scytonema sp. UIC 10036]
MFQQKLTEIDQQLIDLLSKRIAALAESTPISTEEQFTNVTLSLAKASVPESIWKNLVISTTAAVNNPSSPVTELPPRRVTLIGGRGMMGRFFSQRLSAAGHHVSILEQDGWEQAEPLLGKANLVLVCVPIEFTIEVIRKAVKYLAPTTALADIASIKAPIVQAMLEYHSGPVMGLHPMFGPGVKSFLSQNVVVCPGREVEAFQWLVDLIENDGGKLIVCPPEEHDEIMVAIQAIRNFTTFGLGVFLAEEGIDIRRSLDFSSPIFRLEIGLISRLLSQSAPMIVDIMLATPQRRDAICRLANTFQKLAQFVMQCDRDTLIHEFKTAHSCLAEDINCTLEESTHVIDALSTLLAAKEVGQKYKHPSFNSWQSQTRYSPQMDK